MLEQVFNPVERRYEDAPAVGIEVAFNDLDGTLLEVRTTPASGVVTGAMPRRGTITFTQPTSGLLTYEVGPGERHTFGHYPPYPTPAESWTTANVTLPTSTPPGYAIEIRTGCGSGPPLYFDPSCLDAAGRATALGLLIDPTRSGLRAYSLLTGIDVRAPDLRVVMPAWSYDFPAETLTVSNLPSTFSFLTGRLTAIRVGAEWPFGNFQVPTGTITAGFGTVAAQVIPGLAESYLRTVEVGRILEDAAGIVVWQSVVDVDEVGLAEVGRTIDGSAFAPEFTSMSYDGVGRALSWALARPFATADLASVNLRGYRVPGWNLFRSPDVDAIHLPELPASMLPPGSEYNEASLVLSDRAGVPDFGAALGELKRERVHLERRERQSRVAWAQRPSGG